jgi:D-amino acid aminotransferase
MKEHVYLNGRNVPVEKACVSVFDRGLTYGDGLYETMKAIDGRPLFLKEHIARLLHGARELRMEVPLLKPFIDELKTGAIETLLGRNRLNEGEAYVKLMVTRGPDRASHLPTKGVLPTTVIVSKKIETAALAALREKGVAAIAVADISPALPGVKSLNYLSSVLAKMQAEKAGAFEAIFTRDGLVTEGSSSNVFAVKNGVITTPPLEHGPSGGVLPGVIRGEVKRLAARNRTPFSEVPVPLRELEAADEAFLTNSIMEAIPLIKIGKAKIGNGRPGPVTRLFQTLLTPSDQGL